MPIIDAHAHYGEWFFPIRASSAEDILDMFRKFDIEKAIFSSSKAIVYDMSEGNAELKSLLEEHPQFYGYVVANANYMEESKEEIDRYLGLEKFLGLKMHPDYSGQPINSPASKEIISHSARYRKALIVHTWGEQGVSNTLEVAGDFPSLNVIMAHMGGDGLDGAGWRAAIRAAGTAHNTYLEVCGSILDRDRIREAVEQVGAHRILFGSDMTLINPAFVMGMIVDSEISEDDKERIFYRNAKALFSI